MQNIPESQTSQPSDLFMTYDTTQLRTCSSCQKIFFFDMNIQQDFCFLCQLKIFEEKIQNAMRRQSTLVKQVSDDSISTNTSSAFKKSRYDCYGTRIIKGFKGHHIKFDDENLKTIHVVENWKDLTRQQLFIPLSLTMPPRPVSRPLRTISPNRIPNYVSKYNNFFNQNSNNKNTAMNYVFNNNYSNNTIENKENIPPQSHHSNSNMFKRNNQRPNSSYSSSQNNNSTSMNHTSMNTSNHSNMNNSQNSTQIKNQRPSQSNHYNMQNSPYSPYYYKKRSRSREITANQYQLKSLQQVC